MSSTDLVLGFAIREMWLAIKDLWPEERKARYLLRRDVIKPLSTDSMVWPSVFQADDAIVPPQSAQPIAGLWTDFEALEDYLNAGWSNRKPSWLIAVTLSADLFEPDEVQYWQARAYGVTTRSPDESWELLGYDVSDTGLLSGLSNCGYSEREDLAATREKYSSLLNSFHLFTAPEPALEFMQFSDERVPEHAPFFVFGLWLIKREDGS
jgi:hypothetical protein